MDTSSHTTIRIWPKTRKALKILAVNLGQPMVEVLDNLVEQATAEFVAQLNGDAPTAPLVLDAKDLPY